MDSFNQLNFTTVWRSNESPSRLSRGISWACLASFSSMWVLDNIMLVASINHCAGMAFSGWFSSGGHWPVRANISAIRHACVPKPHAGRKRVQKCCLVKPSMLTWELMTFKSWRAAAAAVIVNREYPFFFIDENTETSLTCMKWVVFGGTHNMNLLASAKRSTSTLRCTDALSINRIRWHVSVRVSSRWSTSCWSTYMRGSAVLMVPSMVGLWCWRIRRITSVKKSLKNNLILETETSFLLVLWQAFQHASWLVEEFIPSAAHLCNTEYLAFEPQSS